MYILLEALLLSLFVNSYLSLNTRFYQSNKLCIQKSTRNYNIRNKASSQDIDPILSIDTDDVIDLYRDELQALTGTPELVDKLENLASKFPGIEMNINTYKSIYPFPLDQFQLDGLMSLMKGNSALVSTPTGSGKTVVGELAIYFALMMGLKVAYTTPLKALSNQKYQDFKNRYGADRVGLLTGDIAINRGAAITIMTTEVFRNMIYDSDSSNQLNNLFMVCFDEFHFMNDPDRGTVWEESVISCPPSVRILALSATMGNVEEIRGWISSIHGPTDLILSNHRPVPLRYLFALKQGLMPLFRDPNAGPGSLNGVTKVQGKLTEGSALNPSITKIEDQSSARPQQRISRNGRPFRETKPNVNALVPRYSDVAEKLQKLNLLPAIIFIFSRLGCEEAAKQLMQSGLRLLSDGEVQYVTQAISAFMKANPEIPVNRASFQMLKSGVGVHHAGLIPVWKAFIEDLFNANKIKVLFATETLAAGVNMPARTTVISTVTKRVNSEIIRLKTSQLLQMAGRAGRRGKDDEGTVVVLKNRFEDSRMSHKILTSPVDDIKSHFKTSYGLAIKLLQTRDIPACKSLIEKGFGAYLMQQRIKKKETETKKDVDVYRDTLRKYSLKVAREYYKLLRRYEKEKRNEEYLIEKLIETESDLVQAIADYMPLGVGLLLRNDQSGYFLGDVKWGNRNEFRGFGVLTISGDLYIVQKDHIRCFAENSLSLPPSEAQHLIDLIPLAKEWKDVPLVSELAEAKKPLLQGIYSPRDIPMDSRLSNAYETVLKSSTISVPPLPGSVIRQRQITQEILDELQKSPIYIDNQGESVVQALQYAATLRDPTAFIANAFSNNTQSSSEIYAWKMFQNVLRVLQRYKALNGTAATDLGRMVGSLSGDNELWLALVLQSPLLNHLNESELAAVMSAIVVDGFKATNAYFKFQASDRVKEVYDELDKLSWDLRIMQGDASLEFPINMCREVGGLTESWVNGASWRELCRDTSMDQGDVCRILRRTVEILRQIGQAIGVPYHVSDVALRAANKMDRFPVAELDVQTGEIKDMSGVGFGPTSAIPLGVDSEEGNEYTFDDDEPSSEDMPFGLQDIYNVDNILDDDSLNVAKSFVEEILQDDDDDGVTRTFSSDDENAEEEDDEEYLQSTIVDDNRDDNNRLRRDLTKSKLRMRRTVTESTVTISKGSETMKKTTSVSDSSINLSSGNKKDRLNRSSVTKRNDMKRIKGDSMQQDDDGQDGESDEPVTLFDVDLEELLGITYDKMPEKRNKRMKNADAANKSARENEMFKKKFNQEEEEVTEE